MLRKSVIRGLALTAFAFCQFSTAWAEEPKAAASFLERQHMLGDWGGARTALASHGIIVGFDVTQFYQGVVGGSAGTDAWQYGAKGDLLVTVLGEKLGLWKGLIVNAHLEARGGDDVNLLSGLSPANAAMMMPSSQDIVALTQLMAIQMLSPELGIAGGKFNAFDFVDMAFHTGRGVDGFMNVSLGLPLGLAGTVPLGIFGGGLIKFKGREVQGALLAYDPNNCATTSCLQQPFQDAAVVGVWKFFTGIGPDGKDAGYVAVGGTYSGKQYTVVNRDSFSFAPGQGLTFTDKASSWSVFSVVNQQLWADASNPARALNFKGMYTVTDAKANPIHWSATAALEMRGLFPDRDKDVAGIGYFHTQLNSGFKDVIGPLLSATATITNGAVTRVNIEDTDGFEAYYKVQVTPWLAITGDVQVITETLSTEKTKVVTGLRAKVTF